MSDEVKVYRQLVDDYGSGLEDGLIPMIRQEIR